MNLKLFVTLVVALVLLFAIGIGGGFFQTQNNGVSNWQIQLQKGFETLVPTRTVTFDDIQRAEPGSCLNDREAEIIVQSNADCTIMFTPSNVPRKLILLLREGITTDITLTQPVNKKGSPLTARQSMQRGNPIKLDIYRSQSRNDLISLSVHCINNLSVFCLLDIP